VGVEREDWIWGFHGILIHHWSAFFYGRLGALSRRLGAGGFSGKTTGWERELSAGGCELFTEDYLLGAVSGAARGCGLFTEEDRLVALGGAAWGFGRERY
jgi:hypothetical protein